MCEDVVVVVLDESGIDDAEILKQNSTATHDHCMMRIRTMSEKALLNRVKTIERACGKYAVIKMAVFKVCLQEKSLWDLADAASDALERLKADTNNDDDTNKPKTK